MAENDTAALIVAMEAKLDKFIKGMDSAYSAADRAAKQIEDRFSRLNTAVGKQLESVGYTATSQLGGLGAIFRALGPVGTIAAVAIGGIVLALNAASEAAHNLAAKARELKDLSESTGLTTGELQALNAEASRVGITSERVGEFVQRFTINLAQLREGTGPLVDQLRKIEPTLINQLAAAKSTADAITILSSAYRGLDIARQNALSRAAGGRGGIDLTRLLSEGVDLKALTAEAEAAGRGIDANLIQKIAQLQLDIDKLTARAKGKIASIFSAEVLAAEREYAEQFDRIADRLLEMNKGAGFWTNFWNQVGQALGGQQIVGNAPQPQEAPAQQVLRDTEVRIDALTEKQRKLNEELEYYQRLAASRTDNFWADQDARRVEILRGRVQKVTDQIAELKKEVNNSPLKVTVTPGSITAADNVPIPRSRPTDLPDPFAATRAANLLRPTIAALGDAAKYSEQLDLKTLELKADVEKGILTQDQYTRALTAAKIAQAQAIVGIRERLGVASQEEIVTAGLIQLQQQRAKGLKLTADEAVLAEQIIRKEAQDTFEQLKVRASALPGLTRLGFDAANLNKGLDTLSTDSLNNLTTALSDIVTHTNSASDAFKNLGLQVIRSLSDMIIKMTIVAPIARALQSTLTGGGGLLSFLGVGSSVATAGASAGTSGLATGGGLLHFAGGGSPPAGVPSIVGERGPEIFVPKVPGTIIPNDVARGMGGGVSISMGAPQIIVQGSADQNTLPLIKAALDEYSKSIPGRVVSAVRDAKRRSVSL